MNFFVAQKHFFIYNVLFLLTTCPIMPVAGPSSSSSRPIAQELPNRDGAFQAFEDITTASNQNLADVRLWLQSFGGNTQEVDDALRNLKSNPDYKPSTSLMNQVKILGTIERQLGRSNLELLKILSTGGVDPQSNAVVTFVGRGEELSEKYNEGLKLWSENKAPTALSADRIAKSYVSLIDQIEDKSKEVLNLGGDEWMYELQRTTSFRSTNENEAQNSTRIANQFLADENVVQTLLKNKQYLFLKLGIVGDLVKDYLVKQDDQLRISVLQNSEYIQEVLFKKFAQSNGRPSNEILLTIADYDDVRAYLSKGLKGNQTQPQGFAEKFNQARTFLPRPDINQEALRKSLSDQSQVEQATEEEDIGVDAAKQRIIDNANDSLKQFFASSVVDEGSRVLETKIRTNFIAKESVISVTEESFSKSKKLDQLEQTSVDSSRPSSPVNTSKNVGASSLNKNVKINSDEDSLKVIGDTTLNSRSAEPQRQRGGFFNSIFNRRRAQVQPEPVEEEAVVEPPQRVTVLQRLGNLVRRGGRRGQEEPLGESAINSTKYKVDDDPTENLKKDKDPEIKSTFASFDSDSVESLPSSTKSSTKSDGSLQVEDVLSPRSSSGQLSPKGKTQIVESPRFSRSTKNRITSSNLSKLR